MAELLGVIKQFLFLILVASTIHSGVLQQRRRAGQYDRASSSSSISGGTSRNGQYLQEFENPEEEAEGGGYESYCDEKQSINCAGKALLKCRQSRCSCLQDEDMIYDGMKGQCVAKAGGKCIYGKDEPNPELRQLQRIDCVLHGYCDPESGVCRCSSRFYSSLNVTCVPQKTFEQACHFDTECRDDYHLRCIAGHCICDPRVSMKHRRYDICLGVAGERAIEGNCIEFAEPVNFNPLIPTKCQCLEGYVRGLDKKCHGTLNHSCTTESLCKKGLVCVQGLCQCPFQDYQVLDPEKDTCLSQVYGPCRTSSNCVPTAFCNTTGIYSECQCKPGYIVGSSRHCEKSVGTRCQILAASSSTNNNNNHHKPSSQLAALISGGSSSSTKTAVAATVNECSSSALLQCRDGRCSCSELKTFSVQEGKCVGLVGSLCFPSDESPICTENADCIFRRRLGFGLCSCSPGSIVTAERKCHQVEIPTTTTTTSTERPTTLNNANSGETGASANDDGPVKT